MTCSRTKFTKSDKITIELDYIYMRLSWDQLICPPPFAARHYRNPSSLFIEKMFSCHTEKLHEGPLKRIFPEQTALRVFGTEAGLQGGSFGFRPKTWVARVRPLAVLGIVSPPSGPKVSPAQILG